MVENGMKAPPPKKKPGDTRRRGPGGAGWGLGREKESLVRKLQARMRSLV